MNKRDLISIAIGLLLFFQLQVINFIYDILMESGYVYVDVLSAGWLTDKAFLKPDLLIVPAIFIIVPLINYYKAKK